MSFWNRLAEGLMYAVRGEKAITGLDALIGAGGALSYPKTDFLTLSQEGYEKNAVIYACINELGSSASEPELLVEVKNRKGEWEERPEHSLMKLLQNPNPEMSGYDLQFAMTMYESIAGNCFVEKERSKAGRIAGLWPMRPDRVGIIAVKTRPGERVKRRILGYTWRDLGEPVQLAAQNVMHSKHQHPRDDLFGLPPLASAAREGDTDNKATDYVRSFFDNAAIPKGLLKVMGRISKSEETRVQEALIQTYTGGGGWHKPLVLGEGSEWIELAESFRDMDFPNLRQIGEARLCMVWQVPPIVIAAYTGLMHMTYSNFGEARRSFWQETLMPLYRRREDVLTRNLAWEWGKDVRVRFDLTEVAALQENLADVWKRAVDAFKVGGITRNQFLEEVGFEPVPGGDVFLQPMMMVPVSATKKQLPATPAPEKAWQVKAREIPEEAKEAWARSVDLAARAWEPVFRKAAQDRFGEEKDDLLALLKKEGKAATKGAPFAGFLQAGLDYLRAGRSAWAEIYEPLIAGLLMVQAENISMAYGISFDINRPEVQRFVKGYTFKFADKVQGVSQADLRELIGLAQSEGWSVPKLRDAIMDKWGVYDKNRADMIARTETIRSSNAGTVEAWAQAGVERIQWYAHIDGRQCGWCEEMHATHGPGTDGIAIYDNFAGLGDTVTFEREGKEHTMTVEYENVQYPPLHVRCRCTTLAIIE